MLNILWKIGFLLSITSIMTGCTTMADAKIAQGSGQKAVYSASYEKTFDGVEQVINASSLDLVLSDRDDGELLAQRGVSLASYGENVAVFVSSVSEAETEVEVVSKRAMKTNIFAPNWAERIHEGLGLMFK